MQYLLEHVSNHKQERAWQCVGYGQRIHGDIAVCASVILLVSWSAHAGVTDGASILDCYPTETLLLFEFRLLIPLMNGLLLSAADRLHSDLACDRAPSRLASIPLPADLRERCLVRNKGCSPQRLDHRDIRVV